MQNFEPTLAIFYAIGQIFIIVPKYPNIEKIFPSGHSVHRSEWGFREKQVAMRCGSKGSLVLAGNSKRRETFLKMLPSPNLAAKVKK